MQFAKFEEGKIKKENKTRNLFLNNLQYIKFTKHLVYKINNNYMMYAKPIHI